MDDSDYDLYSPSYRLPCLNRRFAYGLGHILNDFGRTLWFNFLLIYLIAVVNLEHAHVGYILLAGQLVGVVASPFFEYIGSQRNACFCWYTKRKSWHLCGTVLVIAATLLLFMRCLGCSHDAKWIQALYYGSIMVAFQVGWSAIQSSHLGMIPEITRNPNERIELGAIRYTLGIVANLSVFVVLWLLFSISAGSVLGPKDDIWFRALAITVTVTGSIASVIFHLGTDEHGFDLFLDAHLSTTSFERVTWRQWMRQPLFYLISIVHTCLKVSGNLATIYLPFYLFYTLHMQKVYIAAIPMAAYLGKVFLPFATRPLGSCTTPKVTFIMGSVLMVGVGVWAWFLKVYWSLYEIQAVALAVLLGAGGSIASVSVLDMVQRMLGDKTETGSFLYGSLSTLEKVLTGVAVLIVQVLHKEMQSILPNQGLDFYRYVLLAAACLAGLALLVHFALLPMKLSILRERSVIFTSASNGSQTENQNEPSMKPYENTAREDCFNYWSCLSTSNETEAHYVAVTFTSLTPARDNYLSSLGASVNAPYSVSAFEANRRSYSYESMDAMREAGGLRSSQSAPNIIEYSGNHEVHHREAATPKSRPSTKDTAQLLDNEELPESTSTPKVKREEKVTPTSQNVAPTSQGVSAVTVHSEPQGVHEAPVKRDNNNGAAAGSPYDNIQVSLSDSPEDNNAVTI